MKFSEMTYTRLDAEEVKKEIAGLTEALRSAQTYEEARSLFLRKEETEKHLTTQSTLAQIRHDIDTRDAFYDEECCYWNRVMPELEEYMQDWTRSMLDSPFRGDFSSEFGDLMFVNAEIALKTFSPAIIPELQKENDLVLDYDKLIASAQIPFEDGVYTLSQLSPFKNDADDARRLAAWKAEGAWYKEHQDELDRIYDELVRLRDTMGRKLGYDGYTELGYYRMGRNCYTAADVEHFRSVVREYLVPLAADIYKEQAKRLGKEYPMSFADNALTF
ncbi:MAG: M3 family oligoendopeptidase, partial [Oscillospiraceae bacterium]|nr:M3 family oligoendopeptidase [Oscillospiraceae bacterium]